LQIKWEIKKKNIRDVKYVMQKSTGNRHQKGLNCHLVLKIELLFDPEDGWMDAL
jgi:hypothetical protein